MSVFPDWGFFHQQVQTGHIPYILKDTLLEGKILFPILRLDPLQSIRSDLIWKKESECIMVMDSSYCMVQIAHYLVQFHSEESCGKCVPCRLGIKLMGEVIEAITQGRAGGSALQEIETLISLMTQAAYCSSPWKASQIITADHSLFSVRIRGPPSGEALSRRGLRDDVRQGKHSCPRFT